MKPPLFTLQMGRRRFCQLVGSSLGGIVLARNVHASALAKVGAAAPASGTDLEALFANPPDAARTGVYWYWIGGAVTKAGITADLEAMHEAGIGLAMIFSIGKSGANPRVTPPANALTPVWWEMMGHAFTEAERLGMKLGLNICDGWATASGPWITPELSMQEVTWSETEVEGGGTYRAAVTKPPIQENVYRDIALLGIPVRDDWRQNTGTVAVKVTGTLPVSDFQKVLDPKNPDEVLSTESAGWIQFAFEKPFTLRSVAVTTPSPYGYSPGVYRAANSLEVQASDDGQVFRRIGALEYPHHGWQTDLKTLTHALPETTARFFRLVHTPQGPFPYEEDYDFGEDTKLRLCNVLLSSRPRIHHREIKTGQQWGSSRRMTPQDLPDAACIAPDQIVDLTSRLTSDGELRWDVPAGHWLLLRIGHTSTGKHNSAAGLGQGLECDRFNPEAARLQFEGWFGEALRRAGPAVAGRVLKYVHVDSWEAGTQNWSANFAKEFERLRRYSILRYIAVMAGIPIQSAETTERVLHDVRRTIADLVQSNFYQPLARLAHERGCLLSGEPPSPTFPVDGLRHIESLDLPMGEFWLNTPRNDKPTDVKDAVSGARIYGKTVVGAESFTEGMMHWDEHPFTLKALGDHNFCEGINKLLLHVWAHQPWTDRAPGITLNGIGTFFSRTQTWWKPGKAWFDYLHRCQALLQLGRPVVDVAYFIGEDIPSRGLLPARLAPSLPVGYRYDSINRDALLRLTRVEGNELCLDGGMRYRALVLPRELRLTPELARKLHALVAAGAVLVGGQRPVSTPGFTDEKEATRVVGEVTEALWGEGKENAVAGRAVGKGRVFVGASLEQVFGALKVKPDFVANDAGSVALGGGANPPIEWIHRATDEADLYFISNQATASRSFTARFRITGKAPELWYPDTGHTEVAAEWAEEDGVCTVRLRLDASGSVFVVFRKHEAIRGRVTKSDGPRESLDLRVHAGAVEAWARGEGGWNLTLADGTVRQIAAKSVPVPIELNRAWTVSFPNDGKAPIVVTMDQLVSWTTLSQPELNFFSGTAVYETTFTHRDVTLANGVRWFLSLGEVAMLARVQLNGRDLGVLWKPPFEIEVTDAVVAGVNRLRIEVTNTWRNRLAGDDGKPDPERKTVVVPMRRKGKPWLPTEAEGLSPSGLLGPVGIFAAVKL